MLEVENLEDELNPDPLVQLAAILLDIDYALKLARYTASEMHTETWQETIPAVLWVLDSVRRDIQAAKRHFNAIEKLIKDRAPGPQPGRRAEP